jgi:hypothetical protein
MLAVVMGVAAAFAEAAPPALLENPAAAPARKFPPELVDWTPAPENPVFTARGAGHWDKQIRERGWILREGNLFRLWYTGYDGTYEGIKQLGYATSPDGVHWTRSEKNPLCPGHWVEDVMVVRGGDGYTMFAEGADDGDAVLLTSPDGLDWQWRGPITVRTADGAHDVKKPCGTPTAWVENGVWYLFYERSDLGVWLATTSDPLSRVWTNVQDEPVLALGPGAYDAAQIALDQIVKRDGVYFAFYHACAVGEPRVWNTDVARSADLIHWEKYSGNPLITDKSSGVVVPDGPGYRLYTMHAQVDLFLPRGAEGPSSSAPTKAYPNAN